MTNMPSIQFVTCETCKKQWSITSSELKMRLSKSKSGNLFCRRECLTDYLRRQQEAKTILQRSKEKEALVDRVSEAYEVEFRDAMRKKELPIEGLARNMSLREFYVGIAMHAQMGATLTIDRLGSTTSQDIARGSIWMADALIKELNDTKQQKD